jgi:hypothetical protein
MALIQSIVQTSSPLEPSLTGVLMVVVVVLMAGPFGGRIPLLTLQALVENRSLTYPSVQLVQSTIPIKALSLVSLINMLTMAKDGPSTSSSILVSLLMTLRVNFPMVKTAGNP